MAEGLATDARAMCSRCGEDPPVREGLCCFCSEQVAARRVAPDGWAQRPWECMVLTCEGLSYSEISERLGIARRTVASHMTQAFTVLGVGNSRQAIVEFVRAGWFE
jgi:DNA-binding NarL/FixJ family response regulator